MLLRFIAVPKMDHRKPVNMSENNDRTLGEPYKFKDTADALNVIERTR